MELRKLSSNNNKLDNKPVENVINELTKNKSTNIHSGHRARLKQQFLDNGIESLTDIQKLELLLFYAIPQKDTNPIAHNLLNQFGSLKNVIEADYNVLMEVDGIKENSALLIKFIKSLAGFYQKPEYNNQYIISTETALLYVRNLLQGADVEEFYVICLSKNGLVRKYVLINRGSKDEVKIQIRTITQIAIENKTNRIVVCHNHPDGPAEFSDDDYKFTYSLLCSCMLNSIDLLDHIVVGTDRVRSMHENFAMEKLKDKAKNNVQLSKETELFLSASTREYVRSKVDL